MPETNASDSTPSDFRFGLNLEIGPDGKPALVVISPRQFNPTNPEHVAALSEEHFQLYARMIAAVDGFGKPFTEIQEAITFGVSRITGSGETTHYLLFDDALEGDNGN